MKILYTVILLLGMKREIPCRGSASPKPCCSHENQPDRADYEISTYPSPNDEADLTYSTTVALQITATTTEAAELPQKDKSSERVCFGETQATSVYERAHDIDMRYVHDSITSMWRIIFSLIFILILLAFLISYVYSLCKKNHSKRDSTENRSEKVRNFTGTSVEKNAQLYFPVINASRTANFLKDLDPIYDYPCSIQSDYERV